MTLWLPRFLRKYKGFSDSTESIDSIHCDIFYHKSITPQRIPCPFSKFIGVKKLKNFSAGRLVESRILKRSAPRYAYSTGGGVWNSATSISITRNAR